MANSNIVVDETKILTAEQEEALLKPIDEYIDGIQKKIDALRVDGVNRVGAINEEMKMVKENKELDQDSKIKIINKDKSLLIDAKKVAAENKADIQALIKQGEEYLKENYDSAYFNAVKTSCDMKKAKAEAKYADEVAELKAQHQNRLAELNASLNAATTDEEKQALNHDIKDENYVHRNHLFDAKSKLLKEKQDIKDVKHAAYTHKVHLIDLMRNSHFTPAQLIGNKWENYVYSFNTKQFFLKNGLYIVIVIIFIAMCIIGAARGTKILTQKNILNILAQASPRMFFALGVAGLILLTGTDLSIGRMVGLGMIISTMIMHNGPNTATIFGYAFDFSAIPDFIRAIMALFFTIIFTTIFSMFSGFFTSKFKIHPFVSTMSTMLIIFGLATFATNGNPFGGIKPEIRDMIAPKIGGFPTIILWAIAAIVVMWFVWNKTKFGKNLYAVGGNAEAASVSGISVFWVTMCAFIIAGVMYGFGDWLECARMTGSGSASYGQGWDMDAIAACVVGGVSFSGGIGKISGVVTGVIIFTALTYCLTVLGIDTNLQFVFEGIIILAAVTLDSLKYIQKK